MNSHDVRKMQVCYVCSQLGIYQPSSPETDMEIVVCIDADYIPKTDRRYVHPRCYGAKHGDAALLALPTHELKAIRLCDVSAQTMQKILKRGAA